MTLFELYVRRFRRKLRTLQIRWRLLFASSESKEEALRILKKGLDDE